ncbi:MAG: hypothetical protein ACE3JP_13985, partial [Ectobacillus sp.]
GRRECKALDMNHWVCERKSNKRRRRSFGLWKPPLQAASVAKWWVVHYEIEKWYKTSFKPAKK